MLAVVLVRSMIGMKPDLRRTLSLLRLNRKNHCVILRNDKKIIGMLKKVKDYITWGEISDETLRLLIEKRGRLPGNRKVPTEKIDEIVKEVKEGKIKTIKPVFRLHPPRKGWKSLKKAYPYGALGYRGKMDELIKRMI